MSNEVTRTAAEVAADINSIKSHASAIYRAAIDVGKRSCIEIGRLLLEAKGLVHHGEWGKWLAENVDYSESTANNLMRCFKEFGDEQIDIFTGVSDADFFAVLNQSQMLELLALPKEQRRDFVEEHREEIESGEMSVRDMKAEIARLNAENEAKTEADHKTAMDKLKADHEKKLAEMEASFKKQAKASAAGADPSVVRVQIALEGFRREVRAVVSVLQSMQQEGEAQKADKLKAQVEATVGKILAEAGWTV